eukprot:1147178-Pelagomonas_calceolata.AAC.2
MAHLIAPSKLCSGALTRKNHLAASICDKEIRRLWALLCKKEKLCFLGTDLEVPDDVQEAFPIGPGCSPLDSPPGHN